MLRSHTLFLALSILALGAAPAAHDGSPWGRDYFPNIELTTHEGQKVRFYDDLVAGKVVCINFIYTSCPDACPLETARLVEVQDVLGERVGRDVHMYSISIDPERDTPAVLKEYTERFGIGPGWLFLTAPEADVRLLREKLGVLASDEAELQDHSLTLVLGNQATGRWMRRSPFENAHVLANEIGDWLHNWKNAPEVVPDYRDAPKLRNVTRGESLFRTRCSACHVIGEGDGFPRVGPNLAGVLEKRERKWVERWLKEPDRMLAEKDPLALELFAQYRSVPMPNMRLNDFEIASVLDFVAEESARAAALEAEAEPDGETPSCCLKKEVAVLPAATPDAPTQSEILARLPVARSDAQHSPGVRTALALGLGLLLAATALVLRAR
jgi:cytochrome oxidase Cu insertion factor (SCO1/SenC/PrrC family)